MIELEAQIKLMAYLDGELPEREAVEVREWLARDEEARALLAELQNTGAALAGHEAGLKLPETREFFLVQDSGGDCTGGESPCGCRDCVRMAMGATAFDAGGWRGLADLPAGPDDRPTGTDREPVRRIGNGFGRHGRIHLPGPSAKNDYGLVL